MTDTLVILKAVSTSRKLTKTHTADAAGGWVSSGQIQMPLHFSFEVKEAKGIDDLSHILKSLEDDPGLCVIRGEPTNATRASQRPVRRKKANFPPAPRRWVMLDIDAGIELANAEWLADPGPAIKQAIIDCLPPCFHDTCCHWQLSSSAGVKNQTTLKAHLWFWFDRPVNDQDLKTWVRATGMPVDIALFQAVQPHFTAAPIFHGGSDPVKQRSGFIDGENKEVRVPDLTALVVAKQGRGLATRGNVAHGASVVEILAQMGDGDGLQGFHAPIRAAVMRWVRDTHASRWEQQREGMKRAIRDAIDGAPKGAGRDVSIYQSDAYLDGSINGAINRIKEQLITAAQEFAKLDDLIGEECPLEEAERKLAGAVDSWLDEVRHGNAPQSAILAQVGLGKSEQFLRQYAARQDELAGLRTHYMVPENMLANELLDRAKHLGITNCRLHRGRTDEKLGPPLCDRSMHDIAEVIEQAGLSVIEHVCKVGCPFAASCGWFAQQSDKSAGLVFMPNSYSTLPTAKKADATVMDEQFIPELAKTARVRVDRLAPAQGVCVPPCKRFPAASLKLREAERDLKEAREALWTATRGGKHIPTVKELVSVGITAGVAERAKIIEYERAQSIADSLAVAHDWEQKRKIVAAFRAEHGDAWQMAALWRAIEEQLRSQERRVPARGYWKEQDGGREWIETFTIEYKRDHLNGWQIETRARDGGGSDSWLCVGYRAKFKPADKAVLVLDATGHERLLRLVLPQLKQIGRFRAAAPHAKLVQITDMAMGKRALCPLASDTKEDRERKRRRRQDILDVVIAHAAGRPAGLITYKAAEEALENVPAHIFTGHFGALRGKDGWKNSAVLAIAGRPLPRSEDVEALAAALFYDQDECIPLAGAQIGKAEAWYFMADGSIRPGVREKHPSATVELVRSQITEAELIQAIGRARAVRRGARTTVLVLILTNVPLPLGIDELVAWSDLKPSKLDLAFARLGVRGLAATHLAKLCPDLFATEAIAKHEVKGGRGNVLIKRYLLESCPHLTPYTYQLAGMGQRPRTAEFDLDRIPDPAKWLSDNIGPIKCCQPSKAKASEMGQVPPTAPLPQPSAVSQAARVVGHGKLPPLLRLPPTEQARVVRALDELSTATCPPEHFDPLKLIDFGVDAGLLNPADRRHLRKRMRDLGKGYFGQEMQKREFAKPHLYPVLALAELAMRKRGYRPAIERRAANA